MQMQHGPRPPTLDQLQVFLAIVETGSFAAAAKRLGRATSAASYAIANLESQLGLAVFDRVSTRKPQLTDAGRAILADARNMAAGLDGLLARSRGLLAGLESEVSLAVDVMVPTALLVEVLDAFQTEFPTVPVRLAVEPASGVNALVIDGRASIGIRGLLDDESDVLERTLVGAVEFVAVGTPSVAATMEECGRSREVSGAHVELVFQAPARSDQAPDSGASVRRQWSLSDLGAMHAMIRAGTGWGYLPEPMVRNDVSNGRLAVLSGDEWEKRAYRVQAVHRRDVALGPARRWLSKRFGEAGWGS